MAVVIVWEFQVRGGMEREFELAYGAEGEWVKLFRQDKAYLRTELIRDLKEAGRYLTLDFWRSEEAYEAFRQSRKDDYRKIDAQCGELTESEREVRKFQAVGLTTESTGL
jgi:quinol monooxygenase YgiN